MCSSKASMKSYRQAAVERRYGTVCEAASKRSLPLDIVRFLTNGGVITELPHYCAAPRLNRTLDIAPWVR
jgi:hypothetical protein